MASARGSKRNRAALIAEKAGVTWLLQQTFTTNVLLVLNYHRIGDPLNTVYDEEVFSCTAEELADQVDYVKRHFSIIGIDQVEAIVTGRKAPRGVSVLITFDDGYIDNYTLAYPVLRAAGVSGVFFLVTSMIGSSQPTWWDKIAFAIKHTKLREIEMDYPEHVRVDFEDTTRERAVRRMLELYTSAAVQDPARFIECLIEACGVTLPQQPARLFLNWEEAAEMSANGMEIGSHTHTHRLLSKLTLSEQVEELQVSRELLESRLRTQVKALAYPVGLPHTFNSDTLEALRRTGYSLAFSYHGGVNRAGAFNRYDVLRQGIDFSITLPRFRLQTALVCRPGAYWF